MPINPTLDLGQHITFTGAGSGGTGNYVYQWYNNTSGKSVAITGATSNTLTVYANSLSESTGNVTIYSGNSISAGNFKLVITNITPYPSSVYISIYYNGNLINTTSIHAYVISPGSGSQTLNFTSNGQKLHAILSNAIVNLVYQKVNVNLITPYSYYMQVTDTGTSANAISIESSNSQYENIFINPKFQFEYTPNSIITDAGLGYSNDDVNLNIFGGTVPYSIYGINSITDSLAAVNGIAICANYQILFQLSCSFDSLNTTLPGNYVIPITAIDSSNGIPQGNSTQYVHVQINSDLHGTKNGYLQNVILDPTQSYTYSVNANGGTLPYTYNWALTYNGFYSFILGTTVHNIPVVQQSSPLSFTNITVINGCGGLLGQGQGTANSICSFIADNATNGSIKLTTVVTDNAMFGESYTPNYDKIIGESNFTIEQTPIVSVTPSNALLDQNQYETLIVSVSGGAGPFNVEVFNVTGNKAIGNVIVSSGSSNAITFKASQIGVFEYNAIATDEGTTSPFTFNSTVSTIKVNSKLTNTVLKISGKFFDQGETVDLAANSVTGGTPPYTYEFVVTNGNSGKNFFTCIWGSNQCSFTATQPGSYYGNVIVHDNATTPEMVESTNNATFIVSPDLGPLTISLSNSITTLGTPEIITANILGGGGTSPYQYVYTVYNAITNQQVYTTTTNNGATSNSIAFIAPANSFYYATVAVYDNATPSTSVSLKSAVFLVGSSAKPTAFIQDNSKFDNTYDSGQTIGYTVSIFGGLGPFDVELYNITSGSSVANTVIPINAIGATTAIFTLQANTISPISASYNAIIVDTGQIPQYTFNTTKLNIIVNPSLGSNVTVSSNNVELGKPVVITANIHGGTSPYNFTYEVFNSLNALVYKTSNLNVPATNPSNTLVPTSNSITFVPTTLNQIGLDTIVVMVTDKIGANEILPSNTISVTLGQLNVNMPSNFTVNQGSKIVIAPTIFGGVQPYTYQWYNATNSNSLIIGQNTINYSAIASSTGKFGYYLVVKDSNSPANTVTSNTVYVTISPPTTVPPTNTGGGTGGGGGGGGGGGSGTPHPTVLNFTNATDIGYEITNFAVPATTSVTKFNATFNLLMNFISPSQVGISINGNSYTLQLTNKSVSIGTIDSNTYYVELSAISYLPLQNTATVYLYTQKPKSPTTNTKPSNKTVNKNVPSNVSATNKTTTKNTTANITKTAVTTLPSTTQKNSTSLQNTSGSGSSNNNYNAMVPIVEVIILLIILSALYYYFFGKKKHKVGKK